MKKFKPFADVTKTISTDILKKIMQFAIVEGGRLISTDGHLLSVINLTQYITEPDQLKNIEGKIFDAKTCKKLAAADHLTFLENEILIKVKNDLSRIFYPGFIDAAGILTPIDAATGEASVYTVGKYPNWRAVVPHYKNEIFDFSQLKPGPICFSASKIATAATALNSDFLHFFTSEPNRPGLIFTARNFKIENKEVSKIDFESFVLVMPVIHEDLKEYHKPQTPDERSAAITILAAERLAEIKDLTGKIEAIKAENETLKNELLRRIEADKDQPAAPNFDALHFKQRADLAEKKAANLEIENQKLKAAIKAGPDPAPLQIETAAAIVANQPAGILAPTKKPAKKKKEAAAVTAFYKTVNSYKRKRAAGIVKI